LWRVLPIRRGDVFWLAPDESSGDVASYSHPYVVVQDDVFNDSRVTTVIVCALTTNLHRAGEPGNVLLDPGEGELPKQSVVVVSQIASVEKVAWENELVRSLNRAWSRSSQDSAFSSGRSSERERS
jgi:mRNA interferase MazF